MLSTFLVMFLEVSPTAVAMCCAGAAVFVIGAWASKSTMTGARGLDKIAVLSNLCFAIPLAVFGALHLFSAQGMIELVPSYMPWRLFWVYSVGVALIAASLSIASRTAVFWSGLLFGIMMFLFVAMIHCPGALASHGNRITWTIVFRESSFGGGAWLLAGNAMNDSRGHWKRTLITVGRILVAIAVVVFGIEHFLHPFGLPGVPLEKQMPAWVPGRALIDYVTGAALLVTGGSIVLNKKTRTVATIVGGWLVLLILVIYGPVLVGALRQPRPEIQIEGIDYFADTLLFAGVLLALANAMPRSEQSNSVSRPGLNDTQIESLES
jgi:uncharacterized membrane protein